MLDNRYLKNRDNEIFLLPRIRFCSGTELSKLNNAAKAAFHTLVQLLFQLEFYFINLHE